MKVGAGGLQAQVAQDGAPVKKVETERQKLTDKAINTDNSNYQGAVNHSELFKAVEKLNSAAELFNLPYQFNLREKENQSTVELTTRDNARVVKEIPHDRVLALAEQMGQAVGLVLDEHV